MADEPRIARVYWDDAYFESSLERNCRSIIKPKKLDVCSCGFVLSYDEYGILIAQDIQRDDEDGWDQNRGRTYIPSRFINRVEYFKPEGT